MSTLAEIEEAIANLPAQHVEQLTRWLDSRRRQVGLADPVLEPDFLARAIRIWGERPCGKALSEVVSDARD